VTPVDYTTAPNGSVFSIAWASFHSALPSVTVSPGVVG
jgi:hypothetical protein